jgi:HupF/HypC family
MGADVERELEVSDLETGQMSDGCDSRTGCITCGDQAVPMRVVSVSEAGEAVCLEDDGTRHEAIAVDLVGPVAPGDRVLVHAGVAIA